MLKSPENSEKSNNYNKEKPNQEKEIEIYFNKTPLFDYQQAEKNAKEKIESNEKIMKFVKELEDAGYHVSGYGESILVNKEQGIGYYVDLTKTEEEIDEYYLTSTSYFARAWLYENGKVELNDDYWPETSTKYIGPEEDDK